MKIVNVVGTRPNFVKIAPLIREMKKYTKFEPLLVHTGQHYDDDMSESIFKDLQLPEPDVYLGVGSGTHAEQTAKIMTEFEKVCFTEKPDLVVVVGDVNSTIAAALVAAKQNIPIAHIEAGLRSFDRTMPEEINRLLTDRISDFLFTTCEDANINLRNEGIPQSKVFFVGNVMIDTLLDHIHLAGRSDITDKLGLKENGNLKRYAVVTLHRPSNVDAPAVLTGILDALGNLARTIPVIFPVHPRTTRQIEAFGLKDRMFYVDDLPHSHPDTPARNILAVPPLGYLDFLSLLSGAAIVLTDSGGLQEETTILQIPCLTLRNNTERPVTLREGTNILVGNKPEKIVKTAAGVLKNADPRKKSPKYWDGSAAKRIVDILLKKL